MKKVLLALFAVSIATLTFASLPKEFKGTITYKITYEGDEINEQMLTYLPKTMMTYFRDKLTRTDLIMGMGKTIKIKDGEDKSVVSLFDMMGQKVGFTSDYEEIKESMKDEPDSEIEIRNETKEILGYECKRAVIKVEGPGGKTVRMNAWFTEELGDNSNYFDTPEFRDIKGIMLQFEMHAPQFNMIFTAADIDTKKVSKKQFEIPEGYEMRSKEEIEAMFGGGM